MTNEVALDRAMRGKLRPREVDRAIATLAERQHGVVAREQLLAFGVGADAVDRRIGRGHLHRLHRGVYAVGHRVVSLEGRWMAAVLVGGPAAVLSHRSAAALWGLRRSEGAPVEITVDCARRSRPGIEAHRSDLPRDERTVERGIPVTTVVRTLFDLAAVLSHRQVERALEEVEVLRLRDSLSLADLVARYPRRRGARTIKALLESRRLGLTRTRSELEERFVAFLDETGLPRPRLNFHVRAGGRLFECDAVWSDAELVAELDGRAVHETPAAFERDRVRDRALGAAGWRVIRVTWRQLHDGPGALAADLRKLLDARSCT